MTLLPSQNRITLRLPFLSTIRVPGELWFTPGTFTRTSSIVRCSRERTAYLSKTSPARELVSALEAVHAGETIIS
jgi:hypothetical protein